MLCSAVSVRSGYIIFVPNCHFIVLLAGSTITFICETCVGLRFEKDFVSRHLEVEEAVTALKLLRAGATQTDHITTPAKVVEDPPNPITLNLSQVLSLSMRLVIIGLDSPDLNRLM